jgi:hypothetical protein
MSPLPQPGQHRGRTDEQHQEIRNNPLLGRNVNSLRYLCRPSRQSNTPDVRSRGTHPLSTTEQDIFLADTLLAAWQQALESQADFDDDSTNLTTPATTNATTVATTS